MACAVVKTGRTCAVVDVCLAQNALETDLAFTSEVIYSVNAARAVQTRHAGTVVHISFTYRAFKASRTDAAKTIHSVHALTTCSHHLDNSYKHITLQ